MQVTPSPDREHRRIVSTVSGRRTSWAYGAVNGSMEVVEMLSRDIAKYQIQDRVRAAEQDRLSRSSRVGRKVGRPAAVRIEVSGLLAAVLGRRKATPTSTAVGIPMA